MHPRPAAPSRQKAFETILAELDEGGEDEVFRPVTGVERLWPENGEPAVYRAEPVETLYAENQEFDWPSGGLPPQRVADKADFAEIAAEIAAADLGQLRRLRRRCALSAHPDRVAPDQRAKAETLMALVNAAIDDAMRDRRQRTIS